MIDNNDLVEHDVQEWGNFDDKIEVLTPRELAAIAEEMGLSIPEDEPWQTYRDAFSHESWKRFTMAYYKVMRVDYEDA